MLPRLLAAALLLAGFWCLGQQEGRGQLLLGVAKTAAPACAGLTVEGGGTNSGTTATVAVSLTTTSTNDVVILFATVNNGGQITTIADTASLSWGSQRATSGVGISHIEEWFAKSTGILTGDTITVTSPSAGAFIELIAFGVHGSHFAAPFDTGGSSNVPVTATSSPVAVTTNNPNTIIFSGSRDAGQVGPMATFTQIAASSAFTMAQYKTFSATQTALSVSDPDTANGMIGDAIICGP